VKEKRGWDLPLYSISESDFGSDFHVIKEIGKSHGKELKPGPIPAATVFHREADGTIYCTYQTARRGVEKLHSFFGWADMLPDGRGELHPYSLIEM